MGIEDILEYAKADYIKMKGLTEEEVMDLLFERDSFGDDVDSAENPVIEGIEPQLEWFEDL